MLSPQTFQVDNGYRGRKVLVTGATGFIGSHLVENLASLGGNVFGLTRSNKKCNPVQNIQVDMTDYSSLRKALHLVQPEIVFHLAGLVDTRQDIHLVLPTMQNNLIGTVHLLTILKEIGSERIVVLGSSEEPDVFCPGGAPYSPYAASKDAITAYCKLFAAIFNIPVIVARPFMTYGPRQAAEKFIPYSIISLLMKSAPKVSSGKRICDLIFIDDMVAGLLKIGASKLLNGDVVDLGTGKGTSLRSVLELLVELINPDLVPAYGEIPDRLGEYPQIADTTKARSFFDFQSSWSLRDGLAATIEWYRSHE